MGKLLVIDGIQIEENQAFLYYFYYCNFFLSLKLFPNKMLNIISLAYPTLVWEHLPP